LGFVIALAGPIPTGKSKQDKETTNTVGWGFWAFLGLFAIPVFAFGAGVLTATAPIAGVLFIVVGVVIAFQALKERMVGPPTGPSRPA